jgi:hypothetical protein
VHASLSSSRIFIAGRAVVGTGNRLTAPVDGEVDAPAAPLARASA